MAETVNLGMIGLGARAETLLATLYELRQKNIEVTAICDTNPARIQRINEIFEERKLPLLTAVSTKYIYRT